MRTLALVLSISVLASCATPDPDPIGTLRKELSGLNLQAPENDAARDVSAGNPRCYSVNGFSRHFPGIEGKDRAYCSRIEVNFEGTSDVFHGEEHRALIHQASEYAKTYNLYIVRNRKVEP